MNHYWLADQNERKEVRTTPKERYEVISRLEKLGIDYQTAQALRRISMTLHSWFERECGTDNGCIERDEDTGKTYWLNSMTMRRFPIPDRETGARKRLTKIMAGLAHKCQCGFIGACNTCPQCVKPTKLNLVPYIQGDCRGASLYILRAEDVAGHNIDQVYNRGVAVY